MKGRGSPNSPLCARGELSEGAGATGDALASARDASRAPGVCVVVVGVSDLQLATQARIQSPKRDPERDGTPDYSS